MRDFLSSPDWLVEFLCLKALFSLLGKGDLLRMVVLCFLSSGGGFTFHIISGKIWARHHRDLSLSPGSVTL